MKSIQSHMLKTIKPLFKSNYYAFKYYSHLQLHLKHLQSKEILLVYQMGRVGSTTVTSSLETLKLNMPIYHVHSLIKDSIDKTEKLYKDNFSHLGSIHSHLLQSQYLRGQLDRGLESKKWKVITLVRDPIAKNISSFFLSGLELVLNYRLEDKIKYMNTDDIVKELVNLFSEKYHHEVPLTWFDRELKSIFGIDVYSSGFPKEKGYKIYQSKDVNVLLLKLENLNEVAREAFKEFMGIEDFNLVTANGADEKPYYEIYKKFLNTVNLPDSYINKMYESKYAQHFYTGAEIEYFKAKWRR